MDKGATMMIYLLSIKRLGVFFVSLFHTVMIERSPTTKIQLDHALANSPKRGQPNCMCEQLEEIEGHLI